MSSSSGTQYPINFLMSSFMYLNDQYTCQKCVIEDTRKFTSLGFALQKHRRKFFKIFLSCCLVHCFPLHLITSQIHLKLYLGTPVYAMNCTSFTTSFLKFLSMALTKTNNFSRGFPGGSVVKNLPASAGNMGSTLGLGRSHVPRATKLTLHNY